MLGFLFVAVTTLGLIGSISDSLQLDVVAVGVVVGFAGWALLCRRRWGYWAASVIAVAHFGSGVYLLMLGHAFGAWTEPVGIWVFLVPGAAIGLLLLAPASRRWVKCDNNRPFGHWRTGGPGAPPLLIYLCLDLDGYRMLPPGRIGLERTRTLA